MRVGLAAVVTVVGTAALLWWWATGVRGKEDCSAMVGSMELPGAAGDVPRMYSPCDLTGYMDALVGVSILGAVVMVLVPTRRARLIVAVVTVSLTLAIATSGNTFLRV